MNKTMPSMLFSALLLSGAVQAAPFTGEAELGWVTTSGNSETDNLTFKGQANKSYGKVAHNFALEALNSSSSSNNVTTRTAERYLFNYKMDYTVTERGYIFGSLNYEKDRFSGYQYRTNELVGYGHRFHTSETLKTKAELSVGARQSKLNIPVNGDDNVDESIVKALAELRWAISETSKFSEELSVESGDDSTVSKSVTGLKVNLNSSLAMKLTYTVKHTSEVPLGNKKTDRESVVTMVYSF